MPGLQLNPQVLLTGKTSNSHGATAYLRYLQHLRRTQPPMTPYERFTHGYEDFIEIPLQVVTPQSTATPIMCQPRSHCSPPPPPPPSLASPTPVSRCGPWQPLMDNLESQTYETFEKDPVKYSQYQKVRSQPFARVCACMWWEGVVGRALARNGHL
jgi:protein arginine N-methyltransferase 5